MSVIKLPTITICTPLDQKFSPEERSQIDSIKAEISYMLIISETTAYPELPFQT